jgi:TATA-binding protein-associated factor Taf7
MDIQTRKINFVQEFLRLKNEQLINKLEKFLFQEKKKLYEENLNPMLHNEFNEMIDKAKNDAESEKVIDAKKIKEDISSWQ